ncbi:MAG: dTMP kinase, partial [Alphaproteobacteria bacterium]|nr:dTMP kinase [Alphaproteobacteria bacterium]
KLLEAWLVEKGHRVLVTREPGGTEEGDAVRNLLVSGKGQWDGLAEAMLVSAARRHHWTKVIAPALDAGKIVLCDRFSDSTLAYQGAGRGVAQEQLDCLLKLATGGHKPDLTIILSLDPREGLNRAANRRGLENRFEKESLQFHRKIHAEYLKIANHDPLRCQLVDAAQSIETIAATIQKIIVEKIL